MDRRKQAELCVCKATFPVMQSKKYQLLSILEKCDAPNGMATQESNNILHVPFKLTKTDVKIITTIIIQHKFCKRYFNISVNINI